MILDSSAVMAILNQEGRHDRLLEAAAGADCGISAATWVEVGIVADARSPRHGRLLDELLAALDVEVEPVTERHAQLARWAYRRFGRGSSSPAQLNFGDCFAYALATATGEPLLFVGEDFIHTDVPVAEY